MRILLLFFDGVGLGDDNPEVNPFAAKDLSTLNQLAGGQRWLRGLSRIETDRAIFIPTDACLGVEGKPQSATGQATILTGINVPQLIGRHYGPKPNSEIAAIVNRHSLVTKLTEHGFTAGLLNAYPSEYLSGIERGRRSLSSNQLAMQAGNVQMRDGQALLDHRALAADFIGEMWRVHGAFYDAATKVWRTRHKELETPVLAPAEAGRLLASLSLQQDFSLFDYWLTDYIGHRGTITQAQELLKIIDKVLEGLLSTWDDSTGLIVITSDHGNLEQLDDRGHTRNPVPTVIIGDGRHSFAQGLTDLTGFAPAILRAFSD